MSFKITWTGPNGSEEIEVATAADALRECVIRHTSVINLVVKDNHGRRIKPDELSALVHMAGGGSNA